jgi:murein DD-endopeptidase MepM/ murein hydrolase activator NlpD
VVVAAVMVVAALMAVPAGVSVADSHTERDQDVARAAEALEHATEREREAAARYTEATEALPAAEARLREARHQVEQARQAQQAAEDEERAAVAELASATRRHERLRADVESAQARIDSIAAAAYKGSGMYALNSIIASGSPADLIGRLGLLDQIAGQEREALAELDAARARAGGALADAVRARERGEAAREAAQQALATAHTAGAEARRSADEIEALVAARAEALAVAREERERAEAEKARVEAELRAWEEANRDGSPELSPEMTLLMPVAGVKTSDFGMRHHPIYDEPRLHTGVDFAAPGGTPIWAAADGLVIRAGWNGGYGNLTCLSHGTVDGQGLSTCYAHQSEILVGADQRVGAGDVIGRVGTTGTSTGDHLHFEVRLAGTPVDPLPWLPDCLC